MDRINTFDIDGVIYLGEYDGVYPGPNDIIVTGRSVEESVETLAMLDRKGIKNTVYFNPLPFDEKTRESSGRHKAEVILLIRSWGREHGVQIAEIKKLVPDVQIVHVVSDLVTKENVRHK